jgi:hypothetical protein
VCGGAGAGGVLGSARLKPAVRAAMSSISFGERCDQFARYTARLDRTTSSTLGASAGDASTHRRRDDQFSLRVAGDPWAKVGPAFPLATVRDFARATRRAYGGLGAGNGTAAPSARANDAVQVSEHDDTPHIAALAHAAAGIGGALWSFGRERISSGDGQVDTFA